MPINYANTNMLTGVEFNNWQNTYSAVQSNSATNWNYQGTDVKALTANWQNTYSTVQSTSSTWGAGGSFTVEDANSIIGLSIFL